MQDDVTSGQDEQASALREQGWRTSHQVYERRFIGRETELQQLQGAMDAAIPGRGSLVLIGGEAGIGKSALCYQLTAYAEAKGVEVLQGQCYGQVTFQAPYQPFVDALRAHLAGHKTETDSSSPHAEDEHIALLVADWSTTTASLTGSSGNIDEKRWQLFSGVAEYLRRAATANPLLLILEDLHDADQGTLDLLTSLARALVRAPILFLCTHRENVLDWRQPPGAFLAELRRTPNFANIQLRGLQESEIGLLLGSRGNAASPRDQASEVMKLTDGNPLFVQEVMRFRLEQTGTETNAASPASPERVPLPQIPETLRDVVRRRLERLEPETSEVLMVASVLGREFSLSLLGRVSQLDQESLYDALEEATARGILEQRQTIGSVHFRFQHAFLRQAVYDGIFMPRRMLIHQQVAEALEAEARSSQVTNAATLAEHFSQCSSTEDLEKALYYASQAAAHADSLFAFAEASRLWLLAADVHRIVRPTDKQGRSELLLTRGESLYQAGNYSAAANDVAPQAFELAREVGDAHLAWRAARLACESLGRQGTAQTYSLPETARWHERLDEYAAEGTTDRVWADFLLSSRARHMGDLPLGWKLSSRALEQARASGDPDLIRFAAGEVIGGQAGPPESLIQSLSLAHELVENGIGLEDGLFQHQLAFAFLCLGRRREAEARVAQIERIAAQMPVGLNPLLPLLWKLIFKILEGDLEQALAILSAGQVLAERSGQNTAGWMATEAITSRIRKYLGKPEPIPDVMPSIGETMATGVSWASARAHSLAHARHPAGRELHDKVVASLDFGLSDGSLTASFLSVVLQTATLLGDVETASKITARLAPLSSCVLAEGAIGRLVGDAEAMCGRNGAALEAYSSALRTCEGLGYRPEVALCSLGMAKVLFGSRSNLEEARRLLSSAIAGFQAMGMNTFLEEALRLEGELSAAWEDEQPEPRHPAGLSNREVEVLKLLAIGKSNREIATDLYISVNTVARHISSIFNKVGAGNRTEAAALARQLGLAE